MVHLHFRNRRKKLVDYQKYCSDKISKYYFSNLDCLTTPFLHQLKID